MKVRVMANGPFYSCLVSDLGLQRTVLIWKFVLWPIDHFTVVWSVTLDYSVQFLDESSCYGQWTILQLSGQ